MEHIWTMLMHKILQNHLLCAFVANLKICAIYALYPESFCDKNLAIRKVFAFCDSDLGDVLIVCGMDKKSDLYSIMQCRTQFVDEGEVEISLYVHYIAAI